MIDHIFSGEASMRALEETENIGELDKDIVM
jgi:hypothetical protein